jgi:acetyl esterase/lipase
MKHIVRLCSCVLAAVLAAAHAFAADYQVATQLGVTYAEHDGTKLIGDFYLPKGLAKAPAVVAVHGGGWQNSSRATYQYWGPFLARNGIALFTVEYRLGKPGAYPKAVYDVRSAIQFARANAAKFDLDPDRIGIMGDSAGGHLAALLALAGDQFDGAYRDDPMAGTSASVKAMVGFYGVYDMLAQWTHDVVFRPRDSITEKFLGASPMVNRRIYFDSSPISYATVDRNQAHFLLIHGTNDDVVDPATQSLALLTALNQAGTYVRRIVVPGAGHFWASDPFENEPGGFGALTAPRLLRFLQTQL